MSCKIIITSVLLCFCHGKIILNISVASNEIDTKIQYSGDDVKIITEKEIKLFNVTDENLKMGMRIELGKSPDDVFLKNPTVFGDLFEKYKWSEVKRNLRIQKVEIIELLSEEVLIQAHEHINNTTETILTKISMTGVVENTVFSTWSKAGLPYDEIFYDLNINFDYGSLNYENKWRNESMRFAFLPISLTKMNEIAIKPGKTVKKILKANKIILLLKVYYIARLTGSLIANYARSYGKYYFWSPSITSIMKAGKLKNEIITNELIEVRCFSNPTLETFDKSTGKIIKNPKPLKPFLKKIKQKNFSKP